MFLTLSSARIINFLCWRFAVQDRSNKHGSLKYSSDKVMRSTIRIVCELLLIIAVLKQHSNPTGLFCFRQHKDSEINCSWTPSSNTLNINEYTFYLEEEDGKKLFTVNTHLTSVILKRKDLSAGKSYTAWVEANNARLSSSEFTIEDIVKPYPPANVSAIPALDDPTIIMIEWTKPTNLDLFPGSNFQFELQYRLADQKNWTEVSHDEIEVQAISYCLEELQPFTEYEFRIRCGRDGETNKKLWSDWSSVIKAMTLEANPDGVLDVWFMQRRLGSITLLWKPLEQHQARGIIRQYSVSEGDGKEMSKVTNITSCNISLSENTRHVNVTAYNSVGATEPAKLNLVKGQPPVLNLSTLNYNDEIQVCWKAPPRKVLEFVVEWSNMNLPEHQPEWKKIPALKECMALRSGVLQPWIPYKVSVYTRYESGLGGAVSSIVYKEEGVPLTGPTAKIYNITQTSATLTFEAIPLNLCQGFILYYTLYYIKSPQEDSRQKVLNISSALHSFMLSNLEPASTYKIWMTASTIKGESKSGSHLKFKTQASHTVIWKQIVLVLVILASILLCIIVGKCCFYQRIKSLGSFLIPQWCCQKIPDLEVIRTRLQQNLITPDHFGTIENDPEVVKVEETVTLVPQTTSNSLTLKETESLYTEDMLRENIPTQNGETCTDQDIELEEKPVSTKVPGKTCITSGYEKHYVPSPDELLEDEWQLDRKEQWLGLEEYQQ
ncbi:interleukin-12 receptor subunit beta-2-like isoform X1 [Hypanus sabinus]|uniref:interleukin-12 receptor subunit beta-2-like isoform X1 n=2 Tax=Hypanus sabinus TaxID=79690 RepID=UPI0028C5109B|nr:interleukin-12 receptor subunit beta-2-like isoform X1 [Hypanus sabinus]